MPGALAPTVSVFALAKSASFTWRVLSKVPFRWFLRPWLKDEKIKSKLTVSAEPLEGYPRCKLSLYRPTGDLRMELTIRNESVCDLVLESVDVEFYTTRHLAYWSVVPARALVPALGRLSISVRRDIPAAALSHMATAEFKSDEVRAHVICLCNNPFGSVIEVTAHLDLPVNMV